MRPVFDPSAVHRLKFNGAVDGKRVQPLLNELLK